MEVIICSNCGRVLVPDGLSYSGNEYGCAYCNVLIEGIKVVDTSELRYVKNEDDSLET